MKRLLTLLMLMPVLAIGEDFVKMGNMTMGSATAGTNTAVQGNLSVLNGAYIEKGLSVSNGNVNTTGEFQTNGVALVLGGGTIADGSITTNKSDATMHAAYLNPAKVYCMAYMTNFSSTAAAAVITKLAYNQATNDTVSGWDAINNWYSCANGGTGVYAVAAAIRFTNPDNNASRDFNLAICEVVNSSTTNRVTSMTGIPGALLSGYLTVPCALINVTNTGTVIYSAFTPSTAATCTYYGSAGIQAESEKYGYITIEKLQ